MMVVSDTSPITTLLKVDRANLLHDMFGTVVVPRGVADELRAFHSDVPEFVEVRALTDPELRLPGTESLGRGEAEAIRLAKELNAELLLTDDRKARVAAERLGIRCAGLLALAVRAKQSGKLASVRELVLLWEQHGSFYLSDAVRLEALRLAGEEPPAS